jgi:predicted P-type ATPase
VSTLTLTSLLSTGIYVVGAVIPPLLPTVFVVSVGISAKRLQNKRITCTYPEGILVAGKVDAAFFDKTGTLTKQGMDFISVTGSDSGDKSVNERIRIGMAVCHTLTTMSSGELVGNQVDKVSFESTGAVLEHEKGQPARISFLGKQYRVLKQYEFDCHRQSQSVVVEDGDGTKQIFVKGSPEVIKTLCNPLSLPDSFDKSVRESAKSGVYQIAIAFRSFDLDDKKMSDVSRDYVEKSLTFGGFVNFLNVMREETPGVIQELEEGDIVSAMITGDNVLTGICIAREAGMIKTNRTVILGRKTADSELEWVDVDRDVVVKEPSLVLLNSSKCEVDLAMTGEAWRMTLENDPKYATLISKHVRVFGRCTPSDKVSVVATFVANGYKTLMCGDGQNDCGSLKAAHVGVALSSAEASIVAPFTSLDKTITSVTEVLREGRCALASALATYSYYIIYGQTESFLQTINAYFAISFTEWCWVFLDGIWSITMAFSLPLSRAAKRLTPRRPTDSLLGPETMFSVCGILAWNFLYVVIALLALFGQDWFQCRKWGSSDVSNVLTIGDNYETTVIFLVGGYQYVSTAIVLNFGYTFRQNWFKNYIFVVLASTWSLFVFVMTIYPSTFSCIWRVNCDNEVSLRELLCTAYRYILCVLTSLVTVLQDAVRWVTTAYPVAINNPFNTTVMPVGFRWTLVVIMTANLITIMAW